MLSFFFLIVGLVLLMIAADILVRGCVALAERLHVPPLVIGLTVVAFGTSAPELVVSLQAGLAGSGGIAIGNVVGSNIANILLVLGLPSLICATSVQATGAKRNFAVMLAATVLFIVQCLDGRLTRLDGLVLLFFFLMFFVMQFQATRRARRDREALDIPEVSLSVPLAIVFSIGGILALPFAAKLVVDNAIQMAQLLGLSETVIGVTIVAVGTSLPELAAGLMSAWRGQSAMTLGNAIGSNVFNILFILGLTATAVPLTVPPDFLHYELWAMLAAALVLIPFLGLRLPIGRLAGFALVLIYGGLIWGTVALPSI
ncbi:calcium/sodium antiporter [Afifella sp. IM 167]|uniref:calcium/sodium antiporter n=1 Tax=Afifella sp. IM 167 TaxID=2033586 RepID=UPI001CCFB9D3|nr:calcium/sodium antiporter [Afifella sp. IM 167]MBZ8134903.1 sodium:proton exchanger [Afifella sp. IM 167]